MPTVRVTAAIPPSVEVEVDELTDDAISDALEELSEGIEFDGYVAEYIATQGGDWSWEVVYE